MLIQAVLSCDIFYHSSLFQRRRSILFQTFIVVGIVCMLFICVVFCLRNDLDCVGGALNSTHSLTRLCCVVSLVMVSWALSCY